PARSRAFQPEEEMEYVELEERRQREPLRQRRYLDDEALREPYGASYGEREPLSRREVERQWERDDRREPMANPYRGESRQGDDDEREWVRRSEGRDWEPEERGWEREPAPPPLERREEERRRRPLAPEASQRPADRGRGSEPVDVEPEILDDPW
ncbi:MAG: photosystem reaction center subunit H, partial [Cyanobacteriota bacterium]|nr:photosystem reaction center subunit H [Cyanobacteriota bacterium]